MGTDRIKYGKTHIFEWIIHYRTKYPPKLNVWAEIIGNNIIGPFFIDGNLNGFNLFGYFVNPTNSSVTAIFKNCSQCGCSIRVPE
jgi:hypothetical protein